MTAALYAWLDDNADQLDTSSTLAAEIVPRLAEAGQFGIGVPARFGGSDGTTADAIEAIAAVAEHSLTAAFVFWGQRTFIEYLLQGENAALRERWTADLVAGRQAGATGLSNAMKFLSGIESLQITATPDADGLRLDGGLAWITNLRKEGFLAAAAVTMPDGAAPAVVAFADILPGAVRSADLDLLALRGSNTAAVRLDQVWIGAGDVIAIDARAWLPGVRPSFLGMQCGMSIGLARASLRAAHALSVAMRGPLLPRIEELQAELEGHTVALKTGVLDGSFRTAAPAIFRLRIALAAIVQQAVMLELQASGGKAYLQDRDTGFARRWREAAFIPIVTPSLTQLQVELDKHTKA
jgi:alkylation response protein AidB-like acyl-CoA dehydrogenase